MRTVDFYIDRALERSGATSERKLSALLGLSNVGVNSWRSRKALPSDDTMMKLAQIAGIDPYIALLDLNLWRSEGEAKKAYASMLKKITTALIALIILTSSGSSAMANTSKFNSYPETATLSKLYIITSGYIRKLRNFLCKWLA